MDGSQRGMHQTQRIATQFSTERHLMILGFLVPGQFGLPKI